VRRVEFARLFNEEDDEDNKEGDEETGLGDSNFLVIVRDKISKSKTVPDSYPIRRTVGDTGE